MKIPAAMLLLFASLCFCIDDSAAQNRPVQKLQQKRKENRADRLVAEGVALLQKGRPILAQAKLDEALRLDANHARAHLVLAQVLMKNGKDLAAFDHLRKAARYGNPADQAESARLLPGLRTRLANLRTASLPPADHKPSTSSADAKLPSPASGEKPLLAVFAFSDAQLDSSENQLGEALAEMLATSLINRGAYRIIERSQLHRVMQEQALGQTGALETETVVAVGSLLGAQAVVVGSLNRPANIYEADARILSVGTGEAFAASYAKTNSSAQLRHLAETLAHDLSGKAGMISSRAKKDSVSGGKLAQ